MLLILRQARDELAHVGQKRLELGTMGVALQGPPRLADPATPDQAHHHQRDRRCGERQDPEHQPRELQRQRAATIGEAHVVHERDEADRLAVAVGDGDGAHVHAAVQERALFVPRLPGVGRGRRRRADARTERGAGEGVGKVVRARHHDELGAARRRRQDALVARDLGQDATDRVGVAVLPGVDQAVARAIDRERGAQLHVLLEPAVARLIDQMCRRPAHECQDDDERQQKLDSVGHVASLCTDPFEVKAIRD